MNRIVRSFIALAVVALAPSMAFASTAANTAITNTATVNFNDAGGVAQTPVTASATVTVTLVPAAVTLTSPANQTIAQGTDATLVYTITANANGSDVYTLGSAATASNMSAVTPTVPGPITLGGTTLAAAANIGDLEIVVPYDGSANAIVNDIAVGNTIVVGGNPYVVASIVDDAGANTSTIGLTTAIAGAGAAVGTIVGERTTFNVTVASGTVQSGGSGTQTVSTTATTTGFTTTQTTPTVITVNRPTLTVQKLVSTNDGTSFAATGSAAPGTSLIYKIIATNTGATPASAVSFTDVIPAYLTYDADDAKVATSATTTYADATPLTDVADADGFTVAGGTVTYAAGNVAGSGVVVLFFRATVN